MSKTSQATFTQVLKNPGFRLLWANQILLQIAYNSLNFALLIWVFRLTNSVVSASVFVLTIFFPAILFGTVAGILVDISSRKRILIWVNLLLSALFLLLVFARHTYWVILLISFIINSVLQFFVPAEGSSIPLLVKKKQLLLANSLFQTTLFGTLVIGYSLSGPIISFFGISTIFIVGAILLFVGYLIASSLPQIISKPGQEEKRLIFHLSQMDISEAFFATARQIRETFRFIKGRLPVSAAIAILAGVQAVVGTLAVIIPAYMERIMKIRATDASYVVMFPLGLGMVTGAFLIGRFAQNIPRRIIVTRAIILAGIMLLLIATSSIIGQTFSTLDLDERITLGRRSFLNAPSLSLVIAFLAFVLGMCTVSVIIPSQTVLQEYTPDNKRGKIFAVLAVLMSTLAAVPVLIAGSLSDLIGVVPVMVGLGVLVLILGVIGFRPSIFFNKHHLPFRLREFLGLGHWKNDY